MKSSEIAKIPTDSGMNIFAREIAYQLAILNERLDRYDYNGKNDGAINCRFITEKK